MVNNDHNYKAFGLVINSFPAKISIISFPKKNKNTVIRIRYKYVTSSANWNISIFLLEVIRQFDTLGKIVIDKICAK